MNKPAPTRELELLPLYATAEAIAEHISSTRFPVSPKTVKTHWRREGLEFLRIQGRAVARFAEALAIADQKIAKAKPSVAMRGGHDPQSLQEIKRQRAEQATASEGA